MCVARSQLMMCAHTHAHKHTHLAHTHMYVLKCQNGIKRESLTCTVNKLLICLATEERCVWQRGALLAVMATQWCGTNCLRKYKKLVSESEQLDRRLPSFSFSLTYIHM